MSDILDGIREDCHELESDGYDPALVRVGPQAADELRAELKSVSRLQDFKTMPTVMGHPIEVTDDVDGYEVWARSQLWKLRRGETA